MGEKPGIAAALDRAGPGGPPGEAAVQGELLPLPSSAAPGTEARPIEEKKRGPGRPAGSPNKRTEAWTQYLLANYRSPLEGLADAASMRTQDLIDRLELKRADLTNADVIALYKAQIAAAVQLAPYLHSKQPTSIDVGGEGGVRLAFLMPSMAEGGRGSGDREAMIDVTPADLRLESALDEEAEEIQEDSEE
jgi:hypothetical protein